jgi:glycerol-3-phosphate dehydrogenase (NAD(P)+)
MKTAVIGSGNMGTALACVLAENGHTVACWDHMPEVVNDIRKNHLNARFLPGVPLPPRVSADLLLNHVVHEAELILVAAPSRYFRQVVHEFSPFAAPHAVVVGAAKGLEPTSGRRMSQVYRDEAAHSVENYVALSGPSIANELARQKPTAVMLASSNPASLHKAADALQNGYFRTETSPDVIGVELGGVLKNIYALGLGLLDGLHQDSVNVKSAFAVLALAEMKLIAVGLGAEEKTLEGLAGLGDLMTTGFSPDSHHRRLGELLAGKMELPDAVNQLGGIEPEGVRALFQIQVLAEPGRHFPLAELIHRCLMEPGFRPRFVGEVWKIIH